MATTQTYSYGQSDNPQDVCDWIMARGGRAIPVGTSLGSMPSPGVGVLFDTGPDVPARLALPGDQLTYELGKGITVGPLAGKGKK